MLSSYLSQYASRLSLTQVIVNGFRRSTTVSTKTLYVQTIKTIACGSTYTYQNLRIAIVTCTFLAWSLRCTPWNKSCIAVTYPPKFPCCSLPFCGISVSALGVLCTSCVLGLCPNTPNYRTGGATTTVSRRTRAGGRRKGWARITVQYSTVQYVSPALKAVPTGSIDGLHARYTSQQCLERSIVGRKHQQSTYPAPKNKASGTWVVMNLQRGMPSPPWLVDHIKWAKPSKSQLKLPSGRPEW